MSITAKTNLNTDFGQFEINYHKHNEKTCVSFKMGNISDGKIFLRIHSSCLFGEAFNAQDCDCKQQLHQAMRIISQRKKGIVIYLYQEGRGVGLEKKITAINTQNAMGLDTVEAFNHHGYPLDSRDYEVAVQALNDLKASKNIYLMCNNPRKKNSLELGNYKIVEQYELGYTITNEANDYLKVKKSKLGHQINFEKLNVK